MLSTVIGTVFLKANDFHTSLVPHNIRNFEINRSPVGQQADSIYL